MAGKGKALAMLALVIGSLPSCATAPKDVTHLFRESDFEWSKKPGTGSIKGQAFARTNGGEVRSCAGLQVVLVPSTPYTDALDAAASEGTQQFATHPEAFDRYRRLSRGDSVGGFEFDKLPAGAWYIECRLTWLIPGGPWGVKETGVRLAQKVKLAEGQAVKLLITPESMEAIAEKAAAEVPAKPKGPNCPLWC